MRPGTNTNSKPKPKPRLRGSVWGVAVVLTLLGASKPITVDETAYVFYAQQIAEHPGDPYGFEIFWEHRPLPAIEIVAPVGLPYWLAVGVQLFGERPWLWKLWLFPYALLLAWAVRQLLSRFAPGSEGPLLWMMILSPTVVPAFSLMLDVPALALGLGAVATFIVACERDQVRLALLAGLLGAIALQTKYTGFAPIAALVLHGLLQRKWLLLACSLALTVGLFVSWEVWLFGKYTTSHFLHSLYQPPQVARSNTIVGWISGWLALFGALAMPAALLGIVSLRLGSRWLLGALGLCALPFVVVALLPAPMFPVPFGRESFGAGDASFDVFFVSGIFVALIVVASIAASFTRSARPPSRSSMFILGWLAVELISCFSISPFLALRRVIGPVLVGTIAVAHFGSPLASQRRQLWWIATFGVTLGLVYGAADIMDARARLRLHDAIDTKLVSLGYRPDRETVWFTGHWGFQFYAQRRGYEPMIAGRAQIERGDWLLIPNRSSAQSPPRISLSEVLAEVTVSSGFPFSTLPSAYWSGAPIRRQPRFQNRVVIVRALESRQAPPLLRRRRVDSDR